MWACVQGAMQRTEGGFAQCCRRAAIRFLHSCGAALLPTNSRTVRSASQARGINGQHEAKGGRGREAGNEACKIQNFEVWIPAAAGMTRARGVGAIVLACP
jgi:hypothetical protein